MDIHINNSKVYLKSVRKMLNIVTKESFLNKKMYNFLSCGFSCQFSHLQVMKVEHV